MSKIINLLLQTPFNKIPSKDITDEINKLVKEIEKIFLKISLLKLKGE